MTNKLFHFACFKNLLEINKAKQINRCENSLYQMGNLWQDLIYIYLTEFDLISKQDSSNSLPFAFAVAIAMKGGYTKY